MFLHRKICPYQYLKVVQERVKNVLRADSLGDVTESVHRGAPDRLLVSLQHLQQLEANAHPLARAHVFGPAVGDAPHEVDAVFLHLHAGAGGWASGTGFGFPQ